MGAKHSNTLCGNIISLSLPSLEFLNLRYARVTGPARLEHMCQSSSACSGPVQKAPACMPIGCVDISQLVCEHEGPPLRARNMVSSLESEA